MFNKLEQASERKLKRSVRGVEKNPLNLAASWYIAMNSKELGTEPKAIELFARPLVAWRGDDIQP